MHWKITSLWGGKKVELRETPRAVTPFGGLVVFFEFLRHMGYCEAVKQHLPFRLTSHNAIDPVETFTVFVKGAGFSSMRNTPRAKKGPSGTDFSLCGFAPAKRGAQAKINRKPTD